MNDYNESYFENEELDFRNPVQKKIDELKDLMKAELDEETTHQLEYDKKIIEVRDAEIKRLKARVTELENSLTELKNTVMDDKALLMIGKVLKEKINKDNLNKFVEFLFDKEDNEYSEHIDIQLMCNYYSHKEGILNLLDYFDIERVPNIENFRLPIDYTEEEIAVIVKNVYCTSNCNGSYYKDNLRYTRQSLIKPVKSVSSYDNIMWQYVLQNPFVLNHLEEIASNLKYSKYSIFAHVDEYQELTDEQKKILLKGLTPEMFKRKDDFKEWQAFAYRNIHLIEDNQIFIQLAANLNPYDIRYSRKYIGFPEHIRKTLYDKLNICELCEMVKDDKAEAVYRLEILDYITKKMELRAEVEEELKKNGEET